jgi:Calcineurin-like phosphoesterase
VRTLVISDLHLGSSRRADLLRRAELREPLLDALEDVDRLVILGDALELREAAHRDAADIAAPFFAAVGQALGEDGELLLLAGNHDHGLVAGWIDGRLQTEPSGFLGLEQRIEPGEAGRLAARLAELAAPARVSLAYPGVWLREDVYAIHGHYSDVHSTVPTFERLAAGAMARWVVRLPGDDATADAYEAVLAPLYAWMHSLAQRADHSGLTAGAGASARAWVSLAGDGRRNRPLRAAALAGGYAVAVTALNRLGVGPIEPNLSGQALRRGGLHGMREVLGRLGVRAPYVLWGHSHRSGPWPRDDLGEWTTAAGTRLLNTGSWVYQPHFLSGTANESPYWPGTAVVLDDDGEPPRLVRLLGDRGHAELCPPANPPAERSPA